MGWDCFAYKFYWLRDHFLLVARSDHTTGSRNIKPEVVFKEQKMAQYAPFCLIMGSFRGKMPVFCQIWSVRPPWHAPRRRLTRGPGNIRVRVRVSLTTGAVRSGILATTGLLVILVPCLRQYTYFDDLYVV